MNSQQGCHMLKLSEKRQDTQQYDIQYMDIQ